MSHQKIFSDQTGPMVFMYQRQIHGVWLPYGFILNLMQSCPECGTMKILLADLNFTMVFLF